MRISVDQAASLLAFAASLVATFILWQWAGAVYRTDQWKGWLIGASSAGVPVLTLSACVFWLGYRRRAGHIHARVGLLPWLLAVCASVWIAMVLFSLM
jgi:hypothetical protein